MKHRGKVQGIKKGTSSNNADRVDAKGGFRTKSQINLINMWKNGGKAIRNREGKIIKEAQYQSKLDPGTQARVEPNRKWFGNTRVIGQAALQKFQRELGGAVKDPFKVVLKTSKLPLSLLDSKAEPGKEKFHILDNEPYSETFSKGRKRKRPNITADSLEELVSKANEGADNYNVEKDADLMVETDGTQAHNKNPLLNAGQSKRIWGELYRVLDSADVVVQVLDARDPQGTRCRHIERYLEKEKPHKHLVFLLNKVDLQPISVTRKWVQLLQKERPTLAFHASITKPFGKGAMISLLRQFALLHKDKKSISVGFIGYPNVGKSSVINTMRRKKVCNVAPIPGETKVWQFVAMTQRVFLIDCPGVVYSGQEHDETELILRGVCRVENILTPQEHIPEVLKRAKHEHLARLFQVTGWEGDDTGIEFLTKVAFCRGKLLKGGEPDLDGIARTVLRDWQYGKIPFLTQPDETYEVKENKPIAKKNESEPEKKKRLEVIEKRKEIEQKIKINQDYDELKVRDIDNAEEYGGEDEDITEDTPAGDDDVDDEKVDEPAVPAGKGMSEKSILEEKLAKAKKALRSGFLARNEAVKRNADRRQKREEQVDLGAIAREIQREEAKEEAKKPDLTKFEGDEGEEVGAVPKSVESDSDDDEKTAKTSAKEGTSKQRRKAVRDKVEPKGNNYYSTANIKNKNRKKMTAKEMMGTENACAHKITAKRRRK